MYQVPIPQNLPHLQSRLKGIRSLAHWSKTTTRALAQDLLLSTVKMSGSATRFTPRQAAYRQYPLQLLCEYANAVLDSKTGKLLEYRHLMMRPQYKRVWGKSFGNEIGRLTQGIPDHVEGTNTMFFVHKSEVPQDRFQDCTYGRVVCSVREHKEEKHRTRLTIGGDRINYADNCGTPTANLLTVKLLFNSVISMRVPNSCLWTSKPFILTLPSKDMSI